MKRIAILLVWALLVNDSMASSIDDQYEDRLHDWTCQLNYRTPKDFNAQHSFSFGFCFKDPSIYCRQHAVTMNGCKKYQNMGLYCCLMEHVEKRMNHLTHPILTKEMFLQMTGDNARSNRMYEFLLMDTQLANITTPEEIAAFLSIVLMDTHFLLNMEEILPKHLAVNITSHKHKEEVKYIGRGAIFVKGRKFYEWISNVLNKDLQDQEGHNKTLVNALEAPEVLLFPTTAFRAAAHIWSQSYSVLTNASMKQKYKEKSDGSLEGMTFILHNLKGDLHQLPTLIDIWQKIRKVVKCVGEITTKENQKTGCVYPSLCRGKSIIEESDNCDYKVRCKACNKPLDLYLIINPKLEQKEVSKMLKDFIHDVYNRTNASSITVQYSMNTVVGFTSRYYDEIELLHFLQTIPTSPISIDFASVINSTIKQILSNQYEVEEYKPIIAMISDDLQVIDQNAIKEITQAEEMGINFYSLYTKHHNKFDLNSTFALDSRQLNILQYDVTERMCNDPTFITTNSTTSARLSKYEKLQLTLKLKFGEKNIKIHLKTTNGKISFNVNDNLPLRFPYDKDVMYTPSYTVRGSFRIEDTFARFHGGRIKIETVALPEHRVTIYEPSSFEIHLFFEGLEEDSTFEVYISDLDKIDPVIMFEVSSSLFVVSCILSACLLFLAFLIFLTNAPRVYRSIKHRISKHTGHLQEYTLQPDTSACKMCFQMVSENNNNTEKSNNQDIIREESPTSKKSLLVSRIDIPKCLNCTKREDLQNLSHIHCLRIVTLLAFEVTMVMSIFNHTSMENNCKFKMVILIITMNVILFTFISEVMCYLQWQFIVNGLLWWLSISCYSIIFSVAVEQTRNSHNLQNCWPIMENIQGKVILSSIICMVMILFVLVLYSLFVKGRTIIYPRKLSVLVFFLTVLLLAVITVTTIMVHQREPQTTVIVLAISNIILVISVITFALIVQIESNDWIRNLCFVQKIRKLICCRSKEFIEKGEEGHRESMRRSFKQKDGLSSQQPIKKLLVMPFQQNTTCCMSPDIRKCKSPSLPYSIQPVLCNSNTSLENEDQESLDNEYDNSFEIIVRSKRPRSTSSIPFKSAYLEKPKLVQHHSHESVQRQTERRHMTSPSLKRDNFKDNLEAYDVTTFVTCSPPVIEIGHLKE